MQSPLCGPTESLQMADRGDNHPALTLPENPYWAPLHSLQGGLAPVDPICPTEGLWHPRAAPCSSPDRAKCLQDFLELFSSFGVGSGRSCRPLGGAVGRVFGHTDFHTLNDSAPGAGAFRIAVFLLDFMTT